jgi:hypothetical protein
LSLAQEREGQLVVAEKLTQQDIAERIGASRDMISRVMKDLVEGRLSRDRGPRHQDPEEASVGLVDGRIHRQAPSPAVNFLQARRGFLRVGASGENSTVRPDEASVSRFGGSDGVR